MHFSEEEQADDGVEILGGSADPRIEMLVEFEDRLEAEDRLTRQGLANRARATGGP